MGFAREEVSSVKYADLKADWGSWAIFLVKYLETKKILPPVSFFQTSHMAMGSSQVAPKGRSPKQRDKGQQVDTTGMHLLERSAK